MASALYAARPQGWTFGLGVACAAFERLRLERQAGDDDRARESQVAGLAESRRRAEAARASAEQRAEHFERELREERQSRRDRDALANQKVAAAERKAAEMKREIADARTSVEGADARVEREANRARKVEDEVREDLAARGILSYRLVWFEEAEPERYPKAGTPNADVHLGVVSAKGGATRWMDLGEPHGQLVARVNWLPASSAVAVQRLNRVQNRLDLVAANMRTG